MKDEIEPLVINYKHLEPRPRRWRKQLYIKGWNMTVCIILILVFYVPVNAITILFWDDFEDGTWEDKWINAAQGSYKIINAAEYKKMYGHFPLDDPNNKGVLIFGGDEGLANTKDHSFVVKGDPFLFSTAEGMTFESLAQWIVGGQHFVLSASETDTSKLPRNLAYFEPHIRTVLDPVGVVWVQTHWPKDNHITHVQDIPAPPAGKHAKISFYINEKIYKLYIDGKLVHKGNHECGLKKGYMSWSTTGGWGHLDNVVVYTGDYNPRAFEIAMSVEPARKISSRWSAIKNQY